MFPHAMNPLECLTGHGADTQFWVWVLFALCLTNGIEYIAIGIRWLVLFEFSVIQVALITIFLLCMICGYWSFCLAVVVGPDVGYTTKLFLLVFLKAANLTFIVASFGKTFRIESNHMRIGKEVERLAKLDSEIQAQLDEIRHTLNIHG